MRHRLWILARASLMSLFIVCCASSIVLAQVPTKKQAVSLDITTSNGTQLSSSALKGKVVMVYHWSTKCAVCLDKMNELRKNTAGWVGRPFALIAINHDANKQDYLDYVRIMTALKSAPMQMQFAYYKDVAQDSTYQNAQNLPQTYVIDALGELRQSFLGRIPAQSWDLVAELVP